MQRAAFTVLACAVSSFGACRGTPVEPSPMLGPAPRDVVIWPRVAEPFVAHEPSLLTGLDLALRGRGYAARSLAVGRQLLAEAKLLDSIEPRLARIGAALGADAVLQLCVHDFEASSDGLLQTAHWDLEWRLVSTQGAGLLWSHEHRGSWQRAGLDTGDPLRRLDAEPDIVPLGGRGANFRELIDLAAWLHRAALERLPRSEP